VRKDIIVNDPLRYRGVNFFQSSYGQMASQEMVLSFTNQNSGEISRINAAIGQTVDLPDNDGRLTVREISDRYVFRGRQVGEAVLAVLEKPGQQPVELALLPRFPSFDKMRGADWIIAVEKQVQRYYTGLQVTRDPGVPLVYTGFILLITGCWVAFFMSHQKIVLEVRHSTNSSRIQVFGSANRNRMGFEQKIRKLAEALKGL
jgi:cytochrome c biogenesis protein